MSALGVVSQALGKDKAAPLGGALGLAAGQLGKRKAAPAQAAGGTLMGAGMKPAAGGGV